MNNRTFVTGINYQGDGMAVAARSMAGYMQAMEVHAENISHYAIPGYQGKKAVMRRFVEYLGPLAVETTTSETVGRLRKTGEATELALGQAGYFQYLEPATGTIQASRDGRFKIDTQGRLTSLDGKTYLLDEAGQPLVLPKQPSHVDKQLKVTTEGNVYFYNPYGEGEQFVGKIAVVSSTGGPAKKVEVLQGTIEDSNVYLAEEFAGLLPKRREFEANRQMFILQSDSLSRMIQELGRPQ
jgi:flagellar basal body rod protein FlgG